MKKVLAIRHVEIEHLGIFEDILKNLGFTFTYLDTPKGESLPGLLDNYQGLIVLGGYVGAYEDEKYDFLAYEFKLMEEALKKEIPLLGICLGAQMLAKVLGARVYPGEQGKEIGWLEVERVGEHPYFAEFPERLKVFQWHRDTFDLPNGALRVFSSHKYENQGFVYKKAVGLQFHLEVDRKLAGHWQKVYEEEIKREEIPVEVFTQIKDEEEELLKSLGNVFFEKFFSN